MDLQEDVAARSFMSAVAHNKERPHDGFAQAALLLESDHSKVQAFTQICEKQMMLANISDDKYLRYVQTDLALLTHLFDMSQRDVQVAPFFLTMYYTIKSEVQLTRAKDGLEIKAQHAVASAGWKPQGQISGFGGLPQVEQQEDNLFGKIWGKVKPKPKPQQQPY